ncbi:MAG: hypothetical protein M0P73_00100 [Syntrophobacterales bacterium]|jgi:Zn-dependent protease|nr:hypothetical protein [Syntrophobacterales bacterium]
MDPSTAWPVPFVLGPQNLAIDSAVAFVVSVLLACMVNAEAQAFAGTFLGDSRIAPKDRFNFNAFLHVGILGSICYLVAGFGWPRTMDLDRSKFAHPRLYMVIARFAGPIANLLLAGIAGSLAGVMKSWEWDPRVFLLVVGVNITTAVYNLLPIPPLAMGALVRELLPEDEVRTRSLFDQVGPYLIIALVLLERVTHHGIITPYFDSLVRTVYGFITGQ